MAQEVGHPWNVLRQLSMPIWFWDRWKEKVYMNDSLAKEMDTDKTEVSVDQWDPFVHIEGMTEWKELLVNSKYIFSRDKETHIESEHTLGECMVTPLFDDDGHLLGYIGQPSHFCGSKTEMEKMKSDLHHKQALHHALERKEFVLHYQSQVSENGSVNGFEALIRWDQPACGLLSPAQFIRLAEKSGIITQIGEWVLQEACNQLKEWQRKYNRPDLTVAVNFSARQFEDKQLHKKVFQVLDQAQLKAECLTIEITETMVLHDFDHSIDMLNTLRDRGVKVHLDDFGVGYSSLSYLSRLPVDAIKIDRSFVKQIGLDCNKVAIVSAIIAMAQSLGLQVIAEGVESEDHVSFLKEKGCYEYQGYYYSRPKPAEVVSL